MKENLGSSSRWIFQGQPHQYPSCNVKYKTTLSVCVTVNWGIFSNDVVFPSNINDILTCKLDSLSRSTLFYLINYKTIVFMEKQISDIFVVWRWHKYNANIIYGLWFLRNRIESMSCSSWDGRKRNGFLGWIKSRC